MKKKLLFVLLFAALSVIGYHINFSSLLGTENQAFTLFQFFGPITGVFLGPFIGVISVFVAQLANFLLLGKEFTLFNIARLAPMLFAAYYFGAKKKRFVAFVPIICMALFIIHPVGRQVWFYSLYWLVPLIATLFKEKLLLKSLGATFTAHAIGSTAFIYLIPTVPELWIALIPVVFVERVLFALGISLSYIGFNTVLSWFDAKVPMKAVNIDPRYVVRLNALK